MPASNAITELVDMITPQILGGQDPEWPAPLGPYGHELANLILKPLAHSAGPLSAEEVEAELQAGKDEWLSQAPSLMTNRVSLLDGYPEQDLGEPIDWFRAPEGDWQWPTHLSRHYWLLPLAWAWRATRKPEYAEKVVAVLLDWVGKFPGGHAAGLDHHGKEGLASVEGMFPGYCDGPWTSLSAHSRFDRWTSLFQLIWDAPVMTNEVVSQLFLSLLNAHRQTMLDYPRSMNQGMSIANSLIHYNLYYPQFTISEQTATEGMRRMENWVGSHIYPDGSLSECSPNYSAGCCNRLFNLIRKLDRHGCPVPPLFVERLERAQGYFAYSADPSGCTPRLAKGGQNIRGRLSAWNDMFADPRVDYIATAGVAGDQPETLNYLWPWAGHMALRSGWEPDATWLFFDAGPRGNGHTDLACLGVQIKSRGEWILVDPGYYSYSGSGWGLAMSRGYLYTAHAHNTATVDGQSQHSELWQVNTEPGKYVLTEKDGIVTAISEFKDGYGHNGLIAVRHRREIRFEPARNSFVFLDTFDGDGEHRITLNWQLPPQAKLALSNQSTGGDYTLSRNTVSLSTQADGIDLECAVYCGFKEPLAGWFSEHYGQLEKSLTICVSAEATLPIRVKTELTVKPRDAAFGNA